MDAAQGCQPYRSARRADNDSDSRHRHRHQRQGLLCRDAFALSHRSRSGRGSVDRDGKGYDTRLGAHQRSESWHGNRIRRFENRRPTAASGVPPGDVSLQLFNRAPKPKLKNGAQLVSGQSIIHTANIAHLSEASTPIVVIAL
jgi:hypothetical protein